MGNYLTLGVGNYVIAPLGNYLTLSRFRLGNYLIVDRLHRQRVDRSIRDSDFRGAQGVPDHGREGRLAARSGDGPSRRYDDGRGSGWSSLRA